MDKSIESAIYKITSGRRNIVIEEFEGKDIADSKKPYYARGRAWTTSQSVATT